MSSKNLQLIIKKAGLAFSLLFGFVFLSAIDVDAQGRSGKDKYEKQREKIERQREKFEDKIERKQERIEERRDRREDRDDRYDDDYDRDRRDSGYYRNNGYGNYGSGTNYEVARRNGYQDGLRAGADDARDGDRYNPQGHRDFRRATDGYNSRYGNRGQYQQAYRDAFVQGYRESFNRNGRNRNGRWGN